MKLYFARHGNTDANPASIPDPIRGVVDEQLNDLGIKQAKTLAKELQDVEFDAIISSPLKRAFQTAEIVAATHSLPIVINDAFQERKISSHVSMEAWNDLFDFDKNIQLENSENLQKFFQRINVVIDELRLQYKDKTILVVSHGGVHTALYTYANNLPLKGNLRVNNLRNCEYRTYEII
jgi:broad specificity phosphatase PhoE